jgi:uncharacterized membrane protein
MTSDSIPTRVPLVVGALAFVPVAWYGLAGSGTAGIVSAVNVVLILAALVVAMGPVAGSGHHDAASA